MEVGNITKAAIFKSFLYVSYKNSAFLRTVLFNIFMRQTLTDDFGGLHRNMNCAFPLKVFELLFVFLINSGKLFHKKGQTNKIAFCPMFVLRKETLNFADAFFVSILLYGANSKISFRL